MIDLIITSMEDFGGFASSVMLLCTFFVFLFKPLQKWAKKKINILVGTDKQNERLQTLEDNQQNMINFNSIYKETLKLMLEEKLEKIIDDYRGKEFIPVEIKKRMIECHKLYQKNGGNGYFDEMIEEYKHKKSE